MKKLKVMQAVSQVLAQADDNIDGFAFAGCTAKLEIVGLGGSAADLARLYASLFSSITSALQIDHGMTSEQVRETLLNAVKKIS